MPGYALELASSMELIYFDIHRSGEFISNPTKELLEKQIMLSMGVPEITRRYEKDEKCACNLQQYFTSSYLYGDDEIKNRCHAILDYLYAIYDEKFILMKIYRFKRWIFVMLLWQKQMKRQ